MDRFSALRVFAQVVESGGFSRAADRLGLSTTAVSRQLAELEAHLQTRLLNRTTRRLSLTESGQAFYGRAVQLLHDLEEAEQEASKATITARGTIRLTASVHFGTRHVAPAIVAFAARHSGVQFDVQLSDRIVDLVEEGFDLAIRIGGPGSENLVAGRRGEARPVGCGAPDALARAGSPRRGSSRARRRSISRGAGRRRHRRISRGTTASPTNTRRRAGSGASAGATAARKRCASPARCTRTAAD